jgi:hypothetical protein
MTGRVGIAATAGNTVASSVAQTLPIPSSNHSLTDADFATISLIELNGREIKNVVKTSYLLAERSGKPLGVEHIGTVLRITRGTSWENGEFVDGEQRVIKSPNRVKVMNVVNGGISGGHQL